jgi:hypothetical protein
MWYYLDFLIESYDSSLQMFDLNVSFIQASAN